MFVRRIWLLVIGIALVAGLLIVGLVRVQVVRGDEFSERALLRRVASESRPGNRGTLYDRRGVPLVRSEPAWHVELRVGYFRRGSASGILHSLLDAVRSALPVEAPRVAYEALLEDPEPWLDALLDRVRRRDVLAIEGRAFRHDLYRRMVNLFGLEGRGPLIDALEAADASATLREVLTDAAPYGRPLAADPEGFARAALADDRERLTELAVRLGRTRSELAVSIGSMMTTVDRIVDAAIEVHTESIVREDERDPQTARKIARRVVRQDHPFRARRLERAVDRETALWLYLREDDYPGFVVREDRKRVITPGAPYHLVGRVGELSSERVAAAFRASSDAEVVDDARRRDLAWMQHVTSLQPGVAIGASGLERALDETLRCSDGSIRILRDFEGRPAEVLEQTDPADGCDVTLTIDLDLQNAVEEVLVESFGSSGAGSAILMHVETGEILAAAGHPAPRWDETPAELAARRDDPLRSLLPRPFRETAYPYPGSTFKIVPAVAALERGLVDARSTYPCHGFMHRPIDFRCMGYHGDIALESSMERSCNVFYYYLGEELGGTELAEWSRRFGFGRPTGVEFFDGAGHVFDPDSKRPWVRGDARKLAIGQVNVEVTPLQVLRSVLAIGTGGVLVRPRLVASGAADDTWSRGRTERLEIGAATLDLVRRSLVGVVRDPRGTAVGHGLEAFDAAGKTGTAQTGIEDEEHAWFAGYAPSHDPEIGIVVVRERTVLHGGEGAGPVAAAILGEYFARYGSER